TARAPPKGKAGARGEEEAEEEVVLPHLRIARDRRGYETTALVEAGGRRRGGHLLLYFFRTPPSVRVGREAIDPEAMRLLEQHNPDVTFDWGRLLKPGAAGPSGPPTSGSPGSS